ncbi:hypothetical protein DCS_04972 [Drechmeria coniospora]|uniref:Vta1 C-terminal domain-containing protein n=1 Tax=Drechmeria coniospora TaxID=98403 RepID=A0A151GLI0_DRECN|nr:hypothetical protein DCS_04972 [Drechmeria coniospora]KYK57959.1 hypothetical protein DCS_04972 [Drechmeria coniospora]
MLSPSTDAPLLPQPASVEDAPDAGESAAPPQTIRSTAGSSAPFEPSVASPMKQPSPSTRSPLGPTFPPSDQIPLQPPSQTPTAAPRQFVPPPTEPSAAAQPPAWTPPPVTPAAIPPPSPAAASATTARHYKDINQAQKHAKFAISALNFEDVPTAIQELRNALAVLGSQP